MLFGRLWWVVAIGKRQTERKRVEDEDGEEEEWVLYALPSHIVPPPRAGFGTTFGYLALLDLLVAHRAVQHGQSCRPGSGRAGRPPPGSLVNGALIDTGHAKRDDFPWISDRAFDREVTVCSAFPPRRKSTSRGAHTDMRHHRET